MIYRLVDRGADGEIQIRDFPDAAEISARFEKIGVDDCSVDLRMRGLPVFRGLIGPTPERDGTIARYETPEIFEKLTKEWSAPQRRKSRRKAVVEDADAPI